MPKSTCTAEEGAGLRRGARHWNPAPTAVHVDFGRAMTMSSGERAKSDTAGETLSLLPAARTSLASDVCAWSRKNMRLERF